MRLQNILLLVLILGLTCSLQAQSKNKYPSQKGKHSLFFYPLHLSFDFEDYPLEDYTLFPAVGYNFHFKEKWSVQTKLYYRQLYIYTKPSREHNEEKNIKLGLQYYCINKRFQLQLGVYGYLENQLFKFATYTDEEVKLSPVESNEYGFEFGLGFGFRFNEQTRITLGTAIRLRRLSEKNGPMFLYTDRLQLNPVESLGFGYTF